jgi:uncharacterized protein (TIGR03437 family)
MPALNAFRIAAFALLAIPLSAAPTISGIQNAASNIVAGLPNAPIAQGSIFIIKGTGLGPANISISSSPFQATSLSGTSISVVSGGATVAALLYYTSDTQVAALLPSNTPTGSAAFTITYNNQTSNSVNQDVVASNLGLFTVDSSGGGVGIVTYVDGSLVSPVSTATCNGAYTLCGAANPGDTLILWGTGLGPVGGSDASGAGLGVNMTGLPLAVWLGGVQAPVLYQGRSGCCIGEDEVFITVPNKAPTGCAVPLLVQIGNEISNNVVIPVAGKGRNCTPLNPEFAALGAANMEQVAVAGSSTFGQVNIEKDPNGNPYQDRGTTAFMKIVGYTPGTPGFFPSYVDDQPVGTCIVYNNFNANKDVPITNLAPLDAGSTFTVKGPAGTANVPLNGNPATLSGTGSFLVPGNFTVTGSGGADIGPFTANFTIPALPALTSPVSSNNLTVTRANGLTVNWTGGAGNILLQTGSSTDASGNTGTTVNCIVPASAGTFTIPPYAMLAIPATNFSFVAIASAPAAFPFTATGLNIAFVSTEIWGPEVQGFTLR